MEVNISILFSKLSLFASQESKNYLIELIYENKTESISYPQLKPLIIKLSQKTDREIISINIKSKQPTKKQKLLSHGEIVIFKKLLLEKPQERFIILFSKDKENNRNKPNKDNNGKIFVQIKVVDSINNSNITKEIKSKNKLENSNKKEMKNEIIFDDNILDVKAKSLDIKDIQFYNKDEIVSLESIDKLKEMINNEEYKKYLFSKDIDTLKSFNELLFNQYENLNQNYFNILSNILKTNEELKQKAKNNYVNYIQSETDLYKLRLELKQINNDLNQKITENQLKQENYSQNIEKIKSKENYEKISTQKNGDEKLKNNFGDETDIKYICNLIKQLNSMGYNIDNGDITDSERKNLEDLLKNEGNNKLYEKEKENENDNINEFYKENYELSNYIISLIERDVNDLYSRKLIEHVNIDQIDAITYGFSAGNKKNEVTFDINNNNLICSTGETFPVWLIKNFSL